MVFAQQQDGNQAEDSQNSVAEAVHRGLLEPRGNRAIGVVYDPALERYGNYVPTVLPRRYDAFLYIDESHALGPLHPFEKVPAEEPETYPFGV